jgi:hypothetical protein
VFPVTVTVFVITLGSGFSLQARIIIAIAKPTARIPQIIAIASLVSFFVRSSFFDVVMCIYKKNKNYLNKPARHFFQLNVLEITTNF